MKKIAPKKSKNPSFAPHNEVVKNKRHLEEQIRLLIHKSNQIKQGGGEQKIKAQHQKGKLTARERIDYLLDSNSPRLEIGLFAGDGMYADHGGCPSGGVITVLGYVANRLCVVVGNDATVKSGAWFPITAKKNLRAQEIAMANHIPIIYLVDSAGVYLPLQEDVFPDKDHFGRQFFNNARMSALGIVQIAAVMGSCVAGGAYLPAMSDEALIVEKTGSIFLAGSYLVKAAIGEVVDNETLGGSVTHCDLSGVIDRAFPTDQSCLDYIRNVMGKISLTPVSFFDRSKPSPPQKKPKDLYGLMPADRTKPYDMRKIIDHIVDNSSWDEYKPSYGKTLLCVYARIDGWAVGIVANQRIIVKTGKGEMQMGGVIYGDASNKAARFIMNCNQRKIPLVFLQDVSGFMVGRKAEQGGIIKDGAKMVNAMANSTVPKFTFLIGNSFGAGNYAMCGKAYDPRLIFAWPSACIGVMSGASAVKTLFQIKARAAQSAGKVLPREEEDRWMKEIKAHYDARMSPYYAASRLWIDGVIDPVDTRHIISIGISAASHAPLAPFSTGVLQT